jgi:hypothetical protein
LDSPATLGPITTPPNAMPLSRYHEDTIISSSSPAVGSSG